MKQILINSEELQVRVAVVEDGKLQDFFMERNNKDRIVGSIFKGRIKNLEPSLQAAFVDIGVGKNAFLHYWDMLPASQEVLEEADDDDDNKGGVDVIDDDDDAEEADGASEDGEEKAADEPMPILPASAAQPERNNGNGRRNNNGNQHGNRGNNQKNNNSHDSQLIDGLLPIADGKKRSEIIALDKNAKPPQPQQPQQPAPAQPAPAPAPAPVPAPEILPLTATAPAPAPSETPATPEVVEALEAPKPPQLQQFRNQSRKPNNGQQPDVQRQNQEFNRQRAQNQPEGGGSRRRRRRSRGGNRQDGAQPQGSAKQPAAKPSFFRRLCEALLPSSWFSTAPAKPVTPPAQIQPILPKQNQPQQQPKNNAQQNNAAKSQILPLTPDGKPQPVPKKAEKKPSKPEKKGPTVEDIPNLFHVDQEILVQVTKGPIGTKGARVTTNLSIPGRNLVLLPNCSHVGVSRRVEDREERSRLKQMVKSLTLPPNMGLICRTVGAGLKREHFQRDLDILLDAWHKGEELRANRKAPVCIYQEPALEERVLRDCLTQDIDEIVVDTQEAYDRARDMLSRFDKQSVEKLKLYSNPTPIFIKYGIAQQIENISNRKVMLPSGGYLCIDETEALIAIDVNTGKNRSGKDQPETILETNLEAVKEIARQLRLRNIGGLVVLDLIDMRSRKDQMAVYRAFKQYTSEDHARIKIYPISGLGLLEMSRQRESESLESTMFEDCPYCKGRGLIKTATSVSVEIQRRLNELLARRKDVQHFAITVHPKILERLRTADHKVMDAMAQEYNRQISFTGNPNLHIEEYHIVDKATGKEY
jgi:Rne/Rng family ribonuclease